MQPRRVGENLAPLAGKSPKFDPNRRFSCCVARCFAALSMTVLGGQPVRKETCIARGIRIVSCGTSGACATPAVLTSSQSGG